MAQQTDLVTYLAAPVANQGNEVLTLHDEYFPTRRTSKYVAKPTSHIRPGLGQVGRTPKGVTFGKKA